MASTKSLNTPYDSKNGSISLSSSKRSPLNSIIKRKKSTFSQDHSHLNKIYCSLHNSLVKIICTEPNCEPNCLLCEKCDLAPHATHNHKLSNLRQFLQSSMSSLEMKLRQQDEQTLTDLVNIEKFTDKAETELLSFVRCINQQKLEIRKDSERIQTAIEELLAQWKSNVAKMRDSLDETVIDLRKLIVRIKEFSNEESPLMQMLITGTSLGQLYDQLISMSSDSDAARIQNVFKHLIKAANQKFNYQSPGDSEEQKMIAQSLKEIVGILEEIRIKVQNPPRYKFFQNALDKFNSFVGKVTELNDFSKDMSKLLLMSQVNLNMRLNAVGTVSSQGVAHRISSDSLDYVLEDSKTQLCNIEFQSTFKSKHRKGITCCASYGPKCFVTGSFDERLIMWDLQTFEEMKNPKFITLKKVPSSLLTLLDERGEASNLVVGTKDGFVVILDRLFKISQILKEHESQVSSFVYLPHLNVLISAAFDAKIAVYARMEGKFSTVRKLEEAESINCLEVYDEMRFMTGSDDCMVKFWEVSMAVNENKWGVVLLPKTIVNDYSVNTMKMSRVNKRVLAVNSFNKINLWDIDTGRLLNKLRVHRENITKFGLIEFSSLKTSKFMNKKQKNYMSWDPKKPFITAEEITKFSLIIKDPMYLLSFGEDHKISLTDVKNSKKIDERISFKGDVDLNDCAMSLMFFADEREEKVYFLNCINRENAMNLWTIHFERQEP